MRPETIPTPPSPSPDVPLDRAPPEVIPDVSKIQIEDDTPVDSLFAEKQQRLLASTLETAWPSRNGGVPFLVMNNVGLFYTPENPLCPDVMLSVGLMPGDQTIRENRSYFIWHRGKAPDLVLEIVSDRRGGELTEKLKRYALFGVPYYVVFDPAHYLSAEILQSFEIGPRGYSRLPQHQYSTLGLGLTLWPGEYQGMPGIWIRWTDDKGHLLPSPLEAIQDAKDLADQAKLEADQAKLEADQAKQQRDEEIRRRERLEARLRELGMEP